MLDVQHVIYGFYNTMHLPLTARLIVSDMPPSSACSSQLNLPESSACIPEQNMK